MDSIVTGVVSGVWDTRGALAVQHRKAGYTDDGQITRNLLYDRFLVCANIVTIIARNHAKHPIIDQWGIMPLINNTAKTI